LLIQQDVQLIAVAVKDVTHGYKAVAYVTSAHKVDYLEPHVALHSGATTQHTLANVLTTVQFTWTAIMK
jgi:hypothetical protein